MVAEGAALCGSFHTCPKTFTEVDLNKDVVVTCAACDKTVCLTAEQVLHGVAQEVFRCGRNPDSCSATVVRNIVPAPTEQLSPAPVAKAKAKAKPASA